VTFAGMCDAFDRMSIETAMCFAAGLLLVLLGWSEVRRQRGE
jgi:hypothetical protein